MSEFPLAAYVLLFLAVAVFFVAFHLILGKLIRPNRPHEEKGTIYECGEPTIGSAWVQFDLRYYVVALLFVIFDVEVAFFFPWAVVFGQATNAIHQTGEAAGAGTLSMTAEAGRALGWVAFFDILVFFGVLLVGFAYLWKRGDLAWVRSIGTERPVVIPPPAPARAPLAVSR